MNRTIVSSISSKDLKQGPRRGHTRRLRGEPKYPIWVLPGHESCDGVPGRTHELERSKAPFKPCTLTLMSNFREREYRASPLPHPTDFPFSEELNALSAYNICYQQQATGSTLGDTQLIFVRVLGWMLFYAISKNMLLDLSKSIFSCSGNSEKICDLGKFYVDFWIRTCEYATTSLIPLSHVSVFLVRKYKGKTPNISGHVSRPSFDTVAAETKAKLVQYPSSHSVAKDNVSSF